MQQLFVLLVGWTALHCCHALENGQALTPPLGWLSWEKFRCNTDCISAPDDCISEHLIRYALLLTRV